jgi:hypothetical protein
MTEAEKCTNKNKKTRPLSESPVISTTEMYRLSKRKREQSEINGSNDVKKSSSSKVQFTANESAEYGEDAEISKFNDDDQKPKISKKVVVGRVLREIVDKIAVLHGEGISPDYSKQQKNSSSRRVKAGSVLSYDSSIYQPQDYSDLNAFAKNYRFRYRSNPYTEEPLQDEHADPFSIDKPQKNKTVKSIVIKVIDRIVTKIESEAENMAKKSKMRNQLKNDYSDENGFKKPLISKLSKRVIKNRDFDDLYFNGDNDDALIFEKPGGKRQVKADGDNSIRSLTARQMNIQQGKLKNSSVVLDEYNNKRKSSKSRDNFLDSCIDENEENSNDESRLYRKSSQKRFPSKKSTEDYLDDRIVANEIHMIGRRRSLSPRNNWNDDFQSQNSPPASPTHGTEKRKKGRPRKDSNQNSNSEYSERKKVRDDSDADNNYANDQSIDDFDMNENSSGGGTGSIIKRRRKGELKIMVDGSVGINTSTSRNNLHSLMGGGMISEMGPPDDTPRRNSFRLQSTSGLPSLSNLNNIMFNLDSPSPFALDRQSMFPDLGFVDTPSTLLHFDPPITKMSINPDSTRYDFDEEVLKNFPSPRAGEQLKGSSPYRWSAGSAGSTASQVFNFPETSFNSSNLSRDNSLDYIPDAQQQHQIDQDQQQNIYTKKFKKAHLITTNITSMDSDSSIIKLPVSEVQYFSSHFCYSKLI